mmetsp:Transcript_18278/g.33134  ORF Transcript_18278/g.33134 Transcript_18278/m.33134 type:complete len:86 (+) Transcript_18278:126-383(+)
MSIIDQQMFVCMDMIFPKQYNDPHIPPVDQNNELNRLMLKKHVPRHHYISWTPQKLPFPDKKCPLFKSNERIPRFPCIVYKSYPL